MRMVHVIGSDPLSINKLVVAYVSFCVLVYAPVVKRVSVGSARIWQLDI